MTNHMIDQSNERQAMSHKSGSMLLNCTLSKPRSSLTEDASLDYLAKSGFDPIVMTDVIKSRRFVSVLDKVLAAPCGLVRHLI